MESQKVLIGDFTEDFSQINDKPLLISKIEWWLLKYSDIYLKILNNSKDKYVLKGIDERIDNLPLIEESGENINFLDFYKLIDSISLAHRKDNDFKIILTDYYKVKNSPSDLNNWFIKNRSIGQGHFPIFILDHINYSEDDGDLWTWDEDLEIEMFVNKNDVINTLEFIDIYIELHEKYEETNDSK